jgi:hypothetical protein
MARLIFECLGPDGQRVLFETSEKDGQELVEGYAASRQWLLDHGFTPVNAPASRPRSKEPVPFDGRHCPRCHGPVWDNRARKEEDPSKSRWPDFSCRDKVGCRWAVWPGQYELVESTS